MIDSIAQELEHRMSMWQALSDRGGPRDASPALLRELGVFGGGQGIFVDKERTAALTHGGVGVTVGILHTSAYDGDEVFADGILYPYPHTARAAGRDRAEIEATKALQRLGLPLFVIIQTGASKRDVALAWVEGWDDASQVFLLAFGERAAIGTAAVLSEGSPFRAFGREPHQAGAGARFTFHVRRRYGACCALCDLDVPALLDAAHLIPPSSRGTDDPRNGLPLCVLHHRALRAGLVAIEPGTLAIQCRADGPSAARLGITRSHITHLPAHPHETALSWLWEQFSQRPPAS